MSGAQAAAGDLLRARKAAGAAETEIDPALLQSATQTFTAMESYFKARRTYQDGHPALVRFLAQLEERLRAHLSRHGDLEVTVTPRGLEVEGEGVFEVERVDHNMWFPLYRDGVRELTLGDGLERDELLRFLAALTALAAIKPDDDDDDDEGEDDAVTMLWDLELENIGYVAIDTFVDGEGGEAERLRAERVREIVTVSMMKDLAREGRGTEHGRDVEIARRMKSIALSNSDVTFLERENLAALEEIPARTRTHGDLYTLDDRDRSSLRDGVHLDEELVEKFLEAIVQALITDGGDDDAEALCARIEQFFTAIVVEGRFARATALRRHVIDVTQANLDPALVARVDRAMSSDAAVMAIADAIVTRPDDQVGEVFALLELLPATTAAVLLRQLGRVEQRKRRRWACDIMAPWGTAALEAAAEVLPDSAEDYALDVLYLLRRIGSDRAVQVLERACQHASPAIRGGALRLYVEVAPSTAIDQRVRVALRDADPVVRAAALELAVARRPDGCVRWIEEAIEAKDFGALDHGEKMRLLLAYARVGGEAVAPKLIERLGQRNLLHKLAIDEERAAAANALGHLQITGDEPRALLRRLANATLVRGLVKTACAEALARLEAGTPEPAPRAAPVTMPPPQIAAPPMVAITFRPPSQPIARPVIAPPPHRTGPPATTDEPEGAGDD